MNELKLGKLHKRNDPRTLKFAAYVESYILPSIPKQAFYGASIKDWGMMLNDKIGDCTCAGIGHLVQDWTASVGSQFNIPDSDILKAYSDISGYDPKTGRNDTGCNMLDVLNYCCKKGIGGHTIEAYTEVNVKNETNIKAGIYLFEGFISGWPCRNLPKINSAKTNPGKS
jgi:hypothetical protein